MFSNTFDKVDWTNVHWTLTSKVPGLFQTWACKQVMNLTATNKNLRRHHQDGRSDKCKCCTIHVGTADHVILCPEAGRVDAFMQATSILGQWLEDADTDPGVADYIVEYVQPRWEKVRLVSLSSRVYFCP